MRTTESLGKIKTIEIGLPRMIRASLPINRWSNRYPALSQFRRVAGLFAASRFSELRTHPQGKRRRGELRPPRLDGDPTVQHGHDRQLGRAPYRYRAMGARDGKFRTCQNPGQSRVPETSPLESRTANSTFKMEYANGTILHIADERLPQRRALRRGKGLDIPADAAPLRP